MTKDDDFLAEMVHLDNAFIVLLSLMLLLLSFACVRLQFMYVTDDGIVAISHFHFRQMYLRVAIICN